MGTIPAASAARFTLIRTWRRGSALALGLALTLLSVLVLTASTQAVAAGYEPRALPETRSVAGKSLPASDPKVVKLASGDRAPVAWPQGEANLRLPAAAKGAGRQDGFPVSLARGRASKSDASVDVKILPQASAKKAKVDGLLLSVAPTTGTDLAGALAGARATVDYRGFRGAFGGDWASRLRLVTLPACALTTPEVAECLTQTPLVSTNDAKAGSLTADLTSAASLAGSAASTSPQSGARSAQVAGSTMLLAATAGASGTAGNYAATSLAPAGSWSAGGSSGAFTWSLPMETPPSTGGVSPQLALSYSSAAMDGRQVSTNNQSSWVGDGWDYWPGYIERSYQSCSEDQAGGNNTVKTADLCWFTDNAVLSLNGKTSALVRDDATGVWKLQSHDGSRVERRTDAVNGDDNGEHWVVTTPDGTQYWFGRQRLPGWVAGKVETQSTWTVPVFGNQPGEPCRGTTFDASSCDQAWRWNLDYVVDTNGNSMSMFYAKETNHYGRNLKTTGAQYVRGGYLTEIKYGQRTGAEYTNAAPSRVLFGTAERCLPDAAFACTDAQFTTANATRWPDTPIDQSCKAAEACTNRFAPTFWSRKRLTSITTQAIQPDATYANVDSWELTHSFPNQGDGLSPSLWLSSVVRKGHVGGTTTQMPAITFGGTQLANRVDTGSDGKPALYRYRLNTIFGETGTVIGVDYSAPECTATNTPASDSANTMRCYPVWWTPENATDPIKEYFHKYVVTSVNEQDRTAQQPAKMTRYQYLGGLAWAYDDNPMVKPGRRTWNQARGYGLVQTRVGTAPDPVGLTETRYFRGMNGDKLPTGTRSVTVADSDGDAVTDHEQFAGMSREVIYYDRDGGSIVSTTLAKPWIGATVATQARTGSSSLTARAVQNGEAASKTKLADGTWRRTSSTTTYDSSGRATSVSELGDTAKAGDEACTTTEYADNTSAWIMDKPRRVLKVSVPCGVTPTVPADVVSDSRNLYDALAYGAAPTKGNLTSTQQATAYTGSTPTYSTMSSVVVDAVGRTVESRDAKSNLSKTAYTVSPAGYGLVSLVTTTNALGHVKKQYLDVNRGQELAVEDANARRTDVAYDALGRLLKVWLPGRPKTTATPNTEYTYTVSGTAPSVVKTMNLNDDGSYRTQYEMFDGLMRPRQTQMPAVGGGRLVSDWYYNTRGEVQKQNPQYFNSASASATVLVVGDNVVPAQSTFVRDGMGRTTAEIFWSYGLEKWRTSTTYQGEVTSVDPPVGKPATAQVTDALGRVTEKREYASGAISGAYRATTYGYDAKGRMDTMRTPGGATWSYTYDLLGRQTKVVDPDAGAIDTTYDLLGNVVTTTNAKSEVVHTAYDALNRVTQTRDGSATGALRTENTYDTLPNGTVLKGALAKSTRFEGANQYATKYNAYDVAYRPSDWTVSVPAAEGALQGEFTFKMQYTLNGQPYKASFPAVAGLPSETVTYSYDALGYAKGAMGIGGLTYLSDTSYDRYGAQIRQVFGGAAGKIYLDTERDEVTRRTVRTTLDRSISPYRLEQREYTYDQSGNPLSAISTANAVVDAECYRYDGYNRLSDVWTATDRCAAAPSVGASGTVGGAQAYWHHYDFDGHDNRKVETKYDLTGDATKNVVRTYNYPTGTTQPHALLGVAQTGPGARTDTFVNDALGNQTTRTQAGATYTQTWDVEGKLRSSAKAGGDTETYVYDAGGDRLLTKNAASSTLYLGNTEVVLTKSTNKLSGTRMVSLGGATVMRTSDGKVTYVISDTQGTGLWSIDGTTLQGVRRKLTIFGDERPGAAPVSFPARKGFVGSTEDSTGLNHMGAREYDATTGRFTSVDPLMNPNDPQQLNGYSYSANNPVTYSDPSGLMHAAGGGGGGGGGGSSIVSALASIFAPIIAAIVKIVQTVQAYVMKTFGTSGSSSSTPKYTGPSEEQVRKAQEVKKRSVLDIIKEEGAAILLEVLGVDDIKNCFTKGDIGACAMMVAGAIPWTKIVKGKEIIEGLWRAGKAFLRHLDDVKWADETLEQASRACSLVPNSVAPGTRVLLADGSSAPIEELSPGDEVLAQDPETGETGPRRVQAVVDSIGEKSMVEIRGTDLGATTKHAEKIVVTDNHKMWVENRHEWLEAGKVQVGDLLKTSSGTFVQVSKTKAWTAKQKVHNLSVEDLHTFFVVAGTKAVLTHNCDVGDAASEAVDVAARRVTLRVGTKKSVLDAQRAPDGKLYDPNTGVEIPEGKGHFGHRPGLEWRKTQTRARDEGWTRKEVIEFENDASHYWYEDPASNMSHKFEAK